LKQYIFILLFLFSFISCFEDKENEEKEKDLCLNVNCQTYERCIKGSCVLTNGRCLTSNDCLNNQICNETNFCVDNEDCIENETKTVSCGFNGNGLQELICINKIWESGSCIDPDICLNGEKTIQNCGINSLGTLEQGCENGQFVNGKCSVTSFQNGGNYTDKITDIIVKDDFIYITGEIEFMKPETDYTQKDVFIQKLDLNYTVLWEHFIDSTEFANETNPVIQIDENNNIYAGFSTDGTIEGLAKKGQTDYSIFKFTPDGEIDWKIQDGSLHSESIKSIQIKNGTLYALVILENEEKIFIVLPYLISNGTLIDLQEGQTEYIQQSVSNDTEAVKLLIDDENNFYVLLNTSGRIEGITTSGNIDTFLFKYNSDYSFVWYNQVGKDGDDVSFDMFYSAGYVYVAGTTNSQDFYAKTNNGLNDIFVTRTKDDNYFTEYALFGSAGNDYGTSISLNKDGEIYISGFTNSDFEQHIEKDNFDVFILKTDKWLNEIYLKPFVTTSDEELTKMFIDKNNNIYLGGTTKGQFENYILNGISDYFIIKYFEQTTCLSGYESFKSCETNNTSATKIKCNDNNVWESVEECVDIECIPFTVSFRGCGLNYKGSGQFSCDMNYKWTGECDLTISLYETENSEEITDIKLTDEFIYITGIVKVIENGEEISDKIFLTKKDYHFAEIWTQYLESSNNESKPKIAIDSENIYLSGETNGSFPDFSNMTSAKNTFIAKYDFTGALILLNQFQETDDEEFADILINNNELILATNKFNISRYNGIVKKIDKTTLTPLQESISFGNTRNVFISKITNDVDNNLYVIGYSNDVLGNNFYKGGNDIFIAKYNSSLIQEWLKTDGSFDEDIPKDAVFFNKYLYVTGSSINNIEFGTYYEGKDVFAYKIKYDGSEITTNLYGTTGEDVGESIYIDYLGNIFILASTTDVMNGYSNNGFKDVVLLQINEYLQEINIQQYQSNEYDEVEHININEEEYPVKITGINNIIYSVGNTKGSFEENLNNGNSDYFIIKKINDYNCDFGQQVLVGCSTDSSLSQILICDDADSWAAQPCIN